MNLLAQRLSRAIRLEGPLPVSVFMALALHDPQCGFYAAQPSIGRDGAFITAPEISQIFGELLGTWLLQAWIEQGRPGKATVVELGPGRGVLLGDALRAWQHAQDFLDAIEIVLVEASPVLESMQRERLRDAPIPLRWIRQWSDLAAEGALFLLANEFLDALPIRQFVMTSSGWCERMVTNDADERLAFALSPHAVRLEVPESRGAACEGDIYEVSPAALALAEDVARTVSARGGAALFLDYGYHGAGFGETLQGVARHASADVLDKPGETDLSAHVDFAAIAGAARIGGARACGPIDQGTFLKALGIDMRAARLESLNPERAPEIREGVHRLVDPTDMGTLFKVLALVPWDAPDPPGF